MTARTGKSAAEMETASPAVEGPEFAPLTVDLLSTCPSSVNDGNGPLGDGASRLGSEAEDVIDRDHDHNS